MRQINIYVEGKSDIAFVSHFLKHNYSFEFAFDRTRLVATCCQEVAISILTLKPSSGDGGINRKAITNLIKEITTANIPVGIESIILLDTDTDQHNDPKGGFLNRSEYLNSLIKNEKIKFFLIPNNKDDGNLESLLGDAISKNGKTFYNCLCNYVNCLSKITEQRPKGIADIKDFNKTKLDWYTYIMLGKDANHNNYLDVELWDLQTASLAPLKAFFDSIF